MFQVNEKIIYPLNLDKKILLEFLQLLLLFFQLVQVFAEVA